MKMSLAEDLWDDDEQEEPASAAGAAADQAGLLQRPLTEPPVARDATASEPSGGISSAWPPLKLAALVALMSAAAMVLVHAPDVVGLIAPPVLVGAIIGFFTNWLAIKMLFWPHAPWYVLGRRVPFTPGLFVARRADVATAIGSLAEERFCNVEDAAALFYSAQERGVVARVVTEMGPLFKLGWNFYASRSTRESFRADIARIVGKLREQGLIATVIRDKIDSMPVAEVEGMVLRVAGRELSAITWLGAVLGGLCGGVLCFF